MNECASSGRRVSGGSWREEEHQPPVGANQPECRSVEPREALRCNKNVLDAPPNQGSESTKVVP